MHHDRPRRTLWLMSLFFDAVWFDARLQATGISRQTLAAALGLSETEVNEMWKDQRELKPEDVRVLAALLGASPAEIADHAGVSTPAGPRMPATPTELHARIQGIEKRIARIEEMLLTIIARMSS